MEAKGRVLDCHRDWITKKFQLVLEVDNINPEENLSGEKRVILKQWREKRSLSANALLWHCIGEIAKALKNDKWQVYLQLLKRYGEYTYICVIPEAVEKVKEEWREIEEIGEVIINGRKSVQLLCYFGSSNYNTAEFSHLLDGTIEEMKTLGIETPAQEDLRKALETWEKKNGKKFPDIADIS